MGASTNQRTFFGFALADSMFAGDCTIDRRKMSHEEVASAMVRGVIPCLNPSHVATIDAMQKRFNLAVTIPDSPPKVELGRGDTVIVMGVRGLPRLTDRHEYTSEEIAQATFEFTEYSVRWQVPLPRGFTTDLTHVNKG